MTKGTIGDLRRAAALVRGCGSDDPHTQKELDELARRLEALQAREAAGCVRQLAEC